MEFNNLIVDIKEAVATITFNRPKALNALNNELLRELGAALAQLDQDESVKVLVLTGAGEKSFVAGADITELAKCNPLQGKLLGKLGQSTISELQQLSMPVIAAVNGFALGGGCEIALACDFIYAAENAMFGLPEINLGLIPGFGGTQRLPRAIAPGLAKEMIFTGKMIPAAEAQTIGLVNRVCPAESLMEEVQKTATMIATKGNVALRQAKQSINNGLNVDLSSGCAIELDAFALCLASQDAKEGTSAFLEKRQANFQGTLED
jgi:enoyl-CoA hydratase